MPIKYFPPFISGILWGDIKGNISDQTDLQQAMNSIQVSGLTLDLWVNLAGTETGADSFTFEGSSKDACRIAGSLFSCTDDTEAVNRIGYVLSAEENAGIITVTVVSDTDISENDRNFRIAPNQKINNFVHLISIPGELVADPENSQGRWLLDIMCDSFLLPVDSAVNKAAEGSGASCAWNIYKGSTALFSADQDMSANSIFNNKRPDINTINAGDNLSLRITDVGGDTSKPADFQAKLYIVPQMVFS